jgi:hypothetical protein
MSPTDAWRTIKAVARPPIDWHTPRYGDVIQSAKGDEGPLHWLLEVRLSDDVDISFLGKFVSKPEPGAIENRPRDRGACEWFVPAIGIDERIQGYRELGYRRHDAALRASRELIEDMNHARTYGEVWVLAIVTVDQTEVGCSTGAIDAECSRTDLDAMAHEVLDDALYEARAKLPQVIANLQDQTALLQAVRQLEEVR